MHVGQGLLVVELDQLGGPQHRQRERRVVHRQQGAVLGRRGQYVGQPGELLGPERAVVVAGDAGVERDDPQSVHLVHAVLDAVVVGVVEAAGIGGPLVMVAHRPDDDRAHRLGRRLDDLAEGGVRLGLALVGQVSGEDQRLRRWMHCSQPVEGAPQVGDVVDHAVVQPPAPIRCGSERCAIA